MNQEERNRYMASRKWALKRERIKVRAGGMCERCEAAPMEQVHHLTYLRFGDEWLDDLIGLCAPCHEYLSAKSDVDPVLENELRALADFGVSPEGIAVFRRLYPQFKTIFRQDGDVE